MASDYYANARQRLQRVLRNGLLFSLWLIFASIFASCTMTRDGLGTGVQLRDAILLWHNLPEVEAAALNNVLDRYRRANPGIDIVVQQQGSNMEEEFVRATRSGLGPNLLLTSSVNVRTLADAGALLPLDELVSEDVSARYLTVALRTLRHNNQLYGLPMAVDTQVLYFNRSLVERAATTVDQLLQEASAGQRVLMNSQFIDAVWSARTFGVNLFDVEGNPQDATGGIANWLTWMEQVRDTPGFITDDNTPALRDRFLQGDIPYYIGHSNELNLLGESFGANLGVAQLPSGAAGSAGPLLTTSALLINAMSSANQIDLSLDLARFISSSDQQAAMMREANVVPANTRTRISEGLYPRIATVTAQARTAIPYFNDAHIQDAFSVLAAAYNRTMAGMSSATEAALAAQVTLIDEFGFPASQVAATSCLDSGELVVLAPASDTLLSILRTLLDGFADICPGIQVTLQSADLSDPQTLSRANMARSGADLIFLSHGDLRTLVEARSVTPLTELIDSTLVQQMRPIAVNAMRVDNELYGAPILVDLQTLYCNRALIDDSAGTLADLRAQAQGGVPVLLDGAFEYGFWGVGAHGGRLFGDDGQFTLSPTALTEWLTWLQDSQQNFGIRTTAARSEAVQAFLDGRSAYYVASSVRFNELLSQIGSEALSVALMAEGPAGPGRPLASVGALAVTTGLGEKQAALASRLLTYAAGVQAQSGLLLAHRLLPANSSVLLDHYPDVTRMAEQLQSAALLQSRPWLETVFALGDAAYRSVLVDGVAPADAVNQMYMALDADAARYGIVVPTPDPTPVPTSTPVLTPIPISETPPVEEPTPLEDGEGRVEAGGQEGATP